MRFGVCSMAEKPENVKIVKDSGFEYIECRFNSLVGLSDEELNKFKQALDENDIKCEAANCFIPATFKLVGSDDLDEEALKAHIEKGMSRGVELGLKIVVFGSGMARNIPENVTYGEGMKQLTHFLRDIVAPIAKKYGITVVIEPLRVEETNAVNTVKEGAMLAATAESEYIADLADVYHMICSNEDISRNIRLLKGNIKHSHISYPFGTAGEKRLFPKSVDEYDYKTFVDALEYAGCERCSIEAACFDFEKEVPISAKVLKAL